MRGGMRMRNIMKFSDRAWGCDNALTYIFFSDNDRVSKEKDSYRKVVKAQLLYALNNPDENNGQERLDKKELNLIKRLVKSIRKLPAKITGESRLAPIVWIKLAMQISFTGIHIPIANKFMKRYGEWREECQHTGKFALVVQDDPDVKSSATQSTKSRNFIAYSLDVFLLTDIAEFNQLKHTYSIQYKAIDINHKGVAQKIEIPRVKARTKKSDEDQVGSGVYERVKWCITEAANNRGELIKLYLNQDGSKFLYSGTRIDLLNKLKLKDKFKERLKGSVNVHLRAISIFVTCRGCKN